MYKQRKSGAITKTCLFKYVENFTTQKGKFSDKRSDVFHITAQNIDCGYSLEPPQQGGSNEYHNLCFRAKKKRKRKEKLQFYYIKVGLKGSILFRYVFVMSFSSTQSSQYGQQLARFQ